jgi:hypothetical protein
MPTVTQKTKPLTKTATIAAAGNAGTGTAPKDCKNCTKMGLAILPVTGSPALRSLFAEYGDKPADKKSLNGLNGWLDAKDRIQTWDFMRVLPKGYLYVLKPNLVWNAYVVGVDGLLNKMPVDDLPDSPDGTELSKTCKREGHSNVSPQFFCVGYDLDVTPYIHVAFSRHRWTPAVRKRFEANTDGCRTARMTKVDMKAAASGHVGGTSPVPNAGRATASILSSAVGDYTENSFRHRFSGEFLYPLQARSGQAEEVAERMAAASKKTPAQEGIVLYLDDAIGVAEELNTLRAKALHRQQLWLSGGPEVSGKNADPVRPWKRQSAVHVGYLEAWVAQNFQTEQTAAIARHKAMFKQLHDQGSILGAMTKEEFDKRIGPLVKQPVRNPRGGLNPYSGAKWIPMLARGTNKPVASGMGYAELSDAYWAALVDYHAGALTEKKLERYKEHLRQNELKSFNSYYEGQEILWSKLITELDKDYVQYVEAPLLAAALTHDFDDTKKLADAKSDSKKAREEVGDALARLVATERAFGGAAVSEHSVALLQRHLDKKIDAKDNWILKALAADFGFLKVLKSDWSAPSTLPDLYEIAVGAAGQASAESRHQWMMLWQAHRDQASQSAQNLVLPMQQAINHLRLKALADSGGNAGKAAALLEEISKKEVVWVRASALHEYLATTKKNYTIKVKWKLGDYLDAQSSAMERLPGFEIEPRTVGDRRTVRNEMRTARKQLDTLAKDPRFANVTITVPVIVDSSILSVRAGRAGDKMLEVFNGEWLAELLHSSW